MPGKSHGERSLVGYSPLGPKEPDTTKHTYFTSSHGHLNTSVRVPESATQLTTHQLWGLDKVS